MLKFLRILFSPLTLIYGFVINVRNILFDKGIFKEESVDCKVISVGNLTVGGSGKTPLVIHIAKYLKNKSTRVGVLSRGYGRSSKGFKLVSNGEKIFMNVNEAGDEIYLVADECKVPTAVAERRVAGAKSFLDNIETDVILLDDAFQHRWISRDFDILVIDQRFLSEVNSIDQRMLPLGSMREPFESIDRADVVVINRKFTKKITIPNKIKKYLNNRPMFYSYYRISGIYDVKTNKRYAPEEFKGEQSLVVCGIARPISFLGTLKENNVNIKNKIIFTDHKNYTLKEVENIRKKFYNTNSYSVLTTQKDAVKLMQFSKELDDIDIYYLKIDLEFEEPEGFYNLLDSKL